MNTRKTKQASGASLKPALLRFASRVSNAVPAVKGGIHVRCTDCEDEFSLENIGRSAHVAESTGKGAPIVRITGSSSVIEEVLEGRLGAAEALVRGGIRVRGDVEYLERVLRDVGLLHCE
jgi:hypothetical protein